jgi:catechol 2,3-dioxygenase-like lactoylglutathione lyase family enzyme
VPKLASLVALTQVSDLQRSLEFYQRLGFSVANTVDYEGKTTWAWLDNDKASLMITLAEKPVVANQQRVLFYLYGADVEAMHRELTGAGVACGAIDKPFYAPQGEFRVEDPDGYVLMLTHAN